MPHAPKNKMFALGFCDDCGSSFMQDSVSYDLPSLEARVQQEFETDIMSGDIKEGTVLERAVDSGDSSVITFHYIDEFEDPVLFAQIETVKVI